MASTLIDLICRVETLIDKYRPWFDTVARWYDNASTAKKVILSGWVPDVAPACRPLLSVNGQHVDDNRSASGHHLFWMIPPSSLRPGANDIFLWMDLRKTPSLNFGTVTVEHAGSLPGETRQNSRPEPPASSQVSVTVRLGEGFRVDVHRWSAQIHHDTLKFHLNLEERVPESFGLGVAALLPGAGHGLDFEAMWAEVDKLVKDKIKELAKELIRREAEKDPSFRALEKQLADLRAYATLHTVQLKEAVRADANDTLEDVIRRTADPEELIKRLPRARLLGRGMSSLAKLILLVVLAAVAVGIAWKNGWIDAQTLDRIQAAVRGKGPAAVAQKNQQNEQQKQLVQVLEQKKAQTGDVQVSLFWSNRNDLDLHVITPKNERIFFGHPKSACNGRLDVDMNSHGFDSASDKAIENIFWPAGQAPRGRYQIYVNHYHNQGKPGTQDPTHFTVRLVVHGETRWFEGDVVNNDPARKQVKVGEFEVH